MGENENNNIHARTTQLLYMQGEIRLPAITMRVIVSASDDQIKTGSRRKSIFTQQTIRAACRYSSAFCL